MQPKTKIRPSPGVSATSLPVGSRRRGGDGAMWTVAESATGTRRWQKKRPSSTSTSATSSKSIPSASHRILFCEPYAVRSRKELRGVRFVVSDKFYPVLQRAPRVVRARHATLDVVNAYVFGKRFPLSSYEHAGYCGNDGAQIGFIDLDVLNVKSVAKVTDDVLNAYGMGNTVPPSKQIPWENRAALRHVRKLHPHILFLGGTDGGDVGADLYVHRASGRIDGLIVDNGYYFAKSQGF